MTDTKHTSSRPQDSRLSQDRGTSTPPVPPRPPRVHRRRFIPQTESLRNQVDLYAADLDDSRRREHALKDEIRSLKARLVDGDEREKRLRLGLNGIREGIDIALRELAINAMNTISSPPASPIDESSSFITTPALASPTSPSRLSRFKLRASRSLQTVSLQELERSMSFRSSASQRSTPTSPVKQSAPSSPTREIEISSPIPADDPWTHTSPSSSPRKAAKVDNVRRALDYALDRLQRLQNMDTGSSAWSVPPQRSARAEDLPEPRRPTAAEALAAAVKGDQLKRETARAVEKGETRPSISNANEIDLTDHPALLHPRPSDPSSVATIKSGTTDTSVSTNTNTLSSTDSRDGVHSSASPSTRTCASTRTSTHTRTQTYYNLSPPVIASTYKIPTPSGVLVGAHQQLPLPNGEEPVLTCIIN